MNCWPVRGYAGSYLGTQSTPTQNQIQNVNRNQNENNRNPIQIPLSDRVNCLHLHMLHIKLAANRWSGLTPIPFPSNPIQSDPIRSYAIPNTQYPIPIAIRPTMCTTISLILINVPEAFAFASWSASYLCAVFFDSRQQKWRKSSKNCFARQTDSDFIAFIVITSC